MVLDIHENDGHPAIVFLPGQTLRFARHAPGPRPPPASDFPLLFVNALGDNWIVGASNSAPDEWWLSPHHSGHLILTGPNGATTDQPRTNPPNRHHPNDHDIAIPLKIDVSGGLPACALFPG